MVADDTPDRSPSPNSFDLGHETMYLSRCSKYHRGKFTPLLIHPRAVIERMVRIVRDPSTGERVAVHVRSRIPGSTTN